MRGRVAIRIAENKVVQRQVLDARVERQIVIPGVVFFFLEGDDAILHVLGEGLHFAQGFKVGGSAVVSAHIGYGKPEIRGD